MKSTHFLFAILAAILSFSSIAAPVNINTASASEIAQSLKGIGESKAQAIVAYRSSNGHFKTPADIVLVKGIGQSTYIKNKQDILIK